MREFRPHGIRVDAVAPEAIADVIAFLVSDAAGPARGVTLLAYGARAGRHGA
jgi:hypothetical protein